MAINYPYKIGSGYNLEATNPIRYGVRAIQRELHNQGQNPGVIDGKYGYVTAEAAKGFQKAAKLFVDGISGPKTCQALFHNLIVWFSATFEIPGGYLCGQVKNESMFDPGAVGTNGKDSGLVQINLEAHTDVTEAQAFDPVFALAWGGRVLKSAHDTFSAMAHPEVAWDAAILNHNNPALAYKFVRSGTLTDQWAIDYIARIKQGC